jgi:hypothetical protein
VEGVAQGRGRQALYDRLGKFHRVPRVRTV